MLSLLSLSAAAQLDERHTTGNVPIDFYATIVDQDAKPVAGAKVTLEQNVGYMTTATQGNERRAKVIIESDQSGNVALTNTKGISVELLSIEKSGYELSKGTDRFFAYNEAADIFHPDPRHPVVFVLWEKGKRRSLTSGKRLFQFIPDGRPYAINLSSQTITQATNSEGDFQFSLMRPPGVGKWKTFDWSFILKAQGDNLLQQTSQRYSAMLFSPGEGFTNAYQQTRSASDEHWKESGNEQFYIKLHDGQAHGKLSLVWDTVVGANGPKTNKAGILIQYTINPSGTTLVQ